ncbi:hypothetical protein ACIBI8_37430 [Streptomyces sp. NPDC050529]|uniref:hypothetical protein n=1 Tax=Streptomyces sp. NPDC050529 TaxID=3365624 RepID=UPI0037A73E77
MNADLWLDDHLLCTSKYPGGDANANPYDFGSLCKLKNGHAGDHRALAEVTEAHRRYIVWTADGRVLPDEYEKTIRDHPHVDAAGQQTSPSKGDQVT